jgi:4-deoxy-L-threo-5-hexosulose-uronate ketol-isomerase
MTEPSQNQFESAIHRTPRPQEVARMTTEEVREAFLVSQLFSPGRIRGVFTNLDRLAVGGAVPLTPLELSNHKETGRAYLLERRELGAINIGGPGSVILDGNTFPVDRLGCVYAGMGTKKVVFQSNDVNDPAKFYFLSCPAHAAYPSVSVKKDEAAAMTIGTQAGANVRTIRRFIHAGGIQSCQLVMGFTELAEGSVWNTFPAHTHFRRPEIYFYFDFADRIVVHLMGEPTATRHLFVQNEQVVLSPEWSIHSGCGFGNYRFIWGMAGENQTFEDMDDVKVTDLR